MAAPLMRLYVTCSQWRCSCVQSDSSLRKSTRNPFDNRFPLNKIAQYRPTSPGPGSCEGRGHIQRRGRTFLEMKPAGACPQPATGNFRSRKSWSCGISGFRPFLPCWKTPFSADEGSSRAGKPEYVTVADIQAGCTTPISSRYRQIIDRSFARRRAARTNGPGQC